MIHHELREAHIMKKINIEHFTSTFSCSHNWSFNQNRKFKLDRSHSLADLSKTELNLTVLEKQKFTISK